MESDDKQCLAEFPDLFPDNVGEVSNLMQNHHSEAHVSHTTTWHNRPSVASPVQ